VINAADVRICRLFIIIIIVVIIIINIVVIIIIIDFALKMQRRQEQSVFTKRAGLKGRESTLTPAHIIPHSNIKTQIALTTYAFQM